MQSIIHPLELPAASHQMWKHQKVTVMKTRDSGTRVGTQAGKIKQEQVAPSSSVSAVTGPTSQALPLLK